MFTLSAAVFCGTASLIGGFIDAISGGGGLLTVPALLLCGVPPHMAIGTNKMGALFGLIASLCKYASSHLVDWRAAFYGMGFAVLGAWLGSLFVLLISPANVIKIILVLLPLALIGTVLPARKSSTGNNEILGWKFWFLIPCFCLIVGWYDGFFGPGSGTFFILGLHWLAGMGLIPSSATAKAINFMSNLGASIYFAFHNAVFWPLALVMGACFVIGNWAGATFAIHVGAKSVRVFLLFSMLLLLASLLCS